MSRTSTRTAGLSKQTIVLACLLGFGIGVLLTSLGAPLWVYYVAPVTMAPLLVHELRRGTPDETHLTSHDRD